MKYDIIKELKNLGHTPTYVELDDQEVFIALVTNEDSFNAMPINELIEEDMLLRVLYSELKAFGLEDKISNSVLLLPTTLDFTDIDEYIQFLVIAQMLTLNKGEMLSISDIMVSRPFSTGYFSKETRTFINNELIKTKLMPGSELY